MQNEESTKSAKNLTKIIKIDEAEVTNHLSKMVRNTVEQTLNEMLDAEADQLCNAKRYQRTADRADGRAGHYKRKLHTTAGEVELQVPKLRQSKFETAIIESYRRRSHLLKRLSWRCTWLAYQFVESRGHHRCFVGHPRQCRHGQ